MTSQRFTTRDQLRLEVAEPTTTMPNLCSNPDGEVGAWGWGAPVPSTTMQAGEYDGPGLWTMLASSSVAQAWNVRSELVRVTPGQYFGGRAMVGVNATGHRISVRVDWYDASRTYYSSTAVPEWLPALAYEPHAPTLCRIPGVPVPAGAAYAALRLDPYKVGQTGTIAYGGFYLTRVVLCAASSKAAVDTVGWIPPIVYRNLIGPTLNARIVRGDLDVGTLTASLADATVDPATDDLIRPGRDVRLMAKMSTGTWAPLIKGVMGTARVSYPTDRGLPDRKRALIEITATDNTTPLANSGRPQGVALVDHLPWVLDGVGVPWNCNGLTRHLATAPPVVSTNEAASALDQIAITRDSTLGEAWVDRRGVINVWNRHLMPASAMATIGSDTYSAIDVGWSSDDVINEVNVRLLRWNLARPGETVEVPYGPYRDDASVEQWGTYASTFTVHGIADTPAAASAYAATVLAANRTPRRRVRSVTIPIAKTAAFDVAGPGSVFRDLCDRVKIVNATAGLDADLLVRSIEHTITPRKWEMTLGFGDVGSVAAPTLAPPVQSAPLLAVDTWQTLPLGPGWATSSTTPQYLITRDGLVMLRGWVVRSSGTGTTLGTLPAGARPTQTTLLNARNNATGGVEGISINAAGVIAVGGTHTTGNVLSLDAVRPHLNH